MLTFLCVYGCVSCVLCLVSACVRGRAHHSHAITLPWLHEFAHAASTDIAASTGGDAASLRASVAASVPEHAPLRPSALARARQPASLRLRTRVTLVASDLSSVVVGVRVAVDARTSRRYLVLLQEHGERSVLQVFDAHGIRNKLRGDVSDTDAESRGDGDFMTTVQQVAPFLFSQRGVDLSGIDGDPASVCVCVGWPSLLHSG